MNRPIKSAFLATMASAVLLAVSVHAAEFHAFYTSLDYKPAQDPALLGRIPVSAAKVFAGSQADTADLSPRPPEPAGVRWGKYADLVVNVAEGRRLVFARSNQYLPFLETAKGRFLLKPLVDCRPDPMCLCSQVRLIEQTPEHIIVHWRHVPDPASVVMTEVVHEYFIITPDGRARREVRVGTARLADYEDPANVMVQELRLEEAGVTELSLAAARHSDGLAPTLDGAPVRHPPARLPAAWLPFDDGLEPNRDQAKELTNGVSCLVSGDKTLWKRGVSGTALAFDGYHSKVTLPKEKYPRLTNSLSVEAWVALGAYPWNDAGIVHCSSGVPIDPEDYKHGYRDPYVYRPWKLDGYMLGIDPYGRPIFKLNRQQVGGGVVESQYTVPNRDVLPTYRWTHLVGTYGDGKMCLYVDGVLAVSAPASGPIVLPDRDVLIGLNGDAQRISDPVSHSERAANNNMPLIYGIEGLIDEVMIHDRVLTPEEIRSSFEAMRSPTGHTDKVDLEPRILPGEATGRPAEKFGAVYKTLKYHDLWNNLWRPSRYRDVVVRFDAVPGSVVFWQGTNFGSSWVTENNKWMSDQSWEIGGPHGCAEHMADKRGRFDHVRVIENTDARVVVHWRYASIDVGYVFGQTDVWADEYYTIYPDGVGVRWVAGIDGGWQDTQFLSQPGTDCLDNINLQALTVANMNGRSEDLTWQQPNGVPANLIDDACIKRINFKSRWKVFAIYQEGAMITQWGGSEQSKHTADPFAGPWNHWPVGLNPSDGRYAVANDRVTHAAIGGARHTGDKILYGFTDQATASLAALARSWNRAPEISKASGCESKGYDKAQRAYLLSATAGPVSLILAGSKNSPVHHPCFVFDNWDGDAVSLVTANGKKLELGKAARQGIVYNSSGRKTMILYLSCESESPVEIEIRKP